MHTLEDVVLKGTCVWSKGKGGERGLILPSTFIQVCFICMEEGTAASPLVNAVCRCAHRPMHLACQRELASKTPAHAGGNCAVCNSRYTNVHTTSKLELSDAGRRCVVVTVGTIVLAAIGSFEVSMYFVIGASDLQMTYLVVGLIILREVFLVGQDLVCREGHVRVVFEQFEARVDSVRLELVRLLRRRRHLERRVEVDVDNTGGGRRHGQHKHSKGGAQEQHEGGSATV